MLTLLLALLLLLLSAATQAQLGPVPTLVPPTPVRWPVTIELAGPQESAVARILRDGRVRVGILFNAPPFALLNIRGELAGMEADIARSMGEAWGVDVDFVQVTRQSASEMLRSGAVDYLAAALVKREDERRIMEFCQSHYRGAQALMLRQDDEASALAEMNGRVLGVVAGARAESVLSRWQMRSGLRVNVPGFYTLDRARLALLEGEIDGLVDSRLTLRDILLPGELRLLDEVLEQEPHALAVRQGDSALRDLINRSLQFLTASGRMAEIHDANFPDSRLPHDQIVIWDGLGEAAPQLADYAISMSAPAESVVARLEQGLALRVAGLEPLPPDAAASEQRLAGWRNTLTQQLAVRLGVLLQPVAGSPLELVAAGEADLAVGVQPDWSWANRVDFSAPLMLHGERMLVPAESDINNFRGLRNKTLGVLASESGSEDRAQALAESVNVAINLFEVSRDQDINWHLTVEGDVDAVFADSLRLMEPLLARSGWLKLTTRCQGCDPWYSRVWRGLALPKNDHEFRRQVEAALQGMLQDGTLAQLLAPVMPAAAIENLLLQSDF